MRPRASFYLAVMYEAARLTREGPDPSDVSTERAISIAERAVRPTLGRKVQEVHAAVLKRRGIITDTSIAGLRDAELYALRPATEIWPDTRKVVELGTLKLESLVQDDAKEQKRIIYDPIPRVQGIESSEDPLLEVRAAVYLISGRQRRAAP